jgi:hypothetical protein
VQVEVRLNRCGALVRESLDAAAHPAKADVLDHLDRLVERLAAVGKGRVDADAVEEIGCRNGRRRLGLLGGLRRVDSNNEGAQDAD